MEWDNKHAETVNHIKGLQSFILSIEKNGYEKCYSKQMMENVRKHGFRTLKDFSFSYIVHNELYMLCYKFAR